VPTRADAGGICAQTVNWSGRNDLSAAETDNEACSALRIAIF
jgi:hypothetical protein